MPYDPDRRAFVVRTYADYPDASYSVSAYCYDLACQHRAALDLRGRADRYGIDAEVDWRRLLHAVRRPERPGAGKLRDEGAG